MSSLIVRLDIVINNNCRFQSIHSLAKVTHRLLFGHFFKNFSNNSFILPQTLPAILFLCLHHQITRHRYQKISKSLKGMVVKGVIKRLLWETVSLPIQDLAKVIMQVAFFELLSGSRLYHDLLRTRASQTMSCLVESSNTIGTTINDSQLTIVTCLFRKLPCAISVSC